MSASLYTVVSIICLLLSLQILSAYYYHYKYYQLIIIIINIISLVLSLFHFTRIFSISLLWSSVAVWFIYPSFWSVFIFNNNLVTQKQSTKTGEIKTSIIFTAVHNSTLMALSQICHHWRRTSHWLTCFEHFFLEAVMTSES